jgi:putative ABC transport system ATP-binding protein
MASPLISLTDVSLSLQSNAGPVEILKNISLAINPGESVGLIGPSGSGKSSLLMLMGGLERATGGTLAINGATLGDMSEDQLARFRRDTMGIVFQSFHLIPTMTAMENVATPLELAGHRDAFDRARDALDQVGLSHRADHYPAQMSGGEQQRVALARAIVGRPKLLLADEPTGNLDGKNGAAVMDLMFDLQAKFGVTMVLVTHDPALADRCDRTIRLSDGTLMQEDAA